MNRMLHFNGVDFDTGEYAWDPMDESDLIRPIRKYRDPLDQRDLAAFADKRKLDQAGWGLIVHEDEDPAVLQALAALLEHRRSAAGKRYKKMIFLKRDGLPSEKGPTASFLRRYGVGVSGDIDPDKLPYYILIIGDPRLISFEFQYELDIAFAVGRLCFEKPEAYAVYAKNVLFCEREPPQRSAQTILFGAENDDLTRRCNKRLTVPLAQRLAQLQQNWRVTAITGAEANRNRLGAVMGGRETPALLMTFGHGVYLRKAGPAKRLDRQGGLLCSDWQGYGQKVAPEYGFFAEDVGSQLNMRGGMAFFFACFSAGTPRFDNFSPQGQERRELHPYQFVSRLPRALLAQERGPLAVIGHVDQAFEYSFLWDDDIHEMTHFVSAAYQLMEGIPVGAAMEPFNRRFAEVSAQIAAERNRRGPCSREVSRYWLAWHDARNYIVLGDPAVTLKVRS